MSFGHDLGAAAETHGAAAGAISLLDAGAAQDLPTGRKVRTPHEAHQLVVAGAGLLKQVKHGIDDLAEVVRRNVGGHPHGDSLASVDQQVGEPGREDLGLGVAPVEVADKADRLLVDSSEHGGAQLR